MSKVTKKQKIILEKVDPENTYSLADALEIIQSVKSDKFEESIDIAIRLGAVSYTHLTLPTRLSV